MDEMHGRPVSNHELQALITAAGYSHAALARKVNQFAADRHSLDLRYDQTSVYWWLRGRVPEDPVPRLLADVLGGRLGRKVDTDELGFTIVGRLGLTVATSADQAAASAAELWRYVLHRRTSHDSAFVAGAGIRAGFDWHFAPTPHTTPGRATGDRAVGMADVERLHRARLEFVALDRANGGGHAAAWLADHLDRAVTPLLAGRYTAAVGRELFSAVAALTELAGWMFFDQDQHGVAQRFYIQALSLVRQSGDRAYAAHILSNMATQAAFLGHGGDAARLARAARSGAGRAAPPYAPGPARGGRSPRLGACRRPPRGPRRHPPRRPRHQPLRSRHRPGLARHLHPRPPRRIRDARPARSRPAR
ncbi:hypothetical protein GCM10010486_47110 [Nonomuraea roseoviolacea subsp. carminata]